MNKKLLLCVVLICTMLAQSCLVSFAASVSHISYDETTADGVTTVKSNVYVSGLDKAVKLYTAVYNADKSLAATDVSASSVNGYLTTSVTKGEGQTVKSFLWETDNNSPVVKAAEPAELTEDTLNDIDIRINGVAASDFVGEAIALNGSYDIGIMENDLHSIPKVTATTDDSTISLGVKTYPEELKTVVRIAKGALNEADEIVTLPTSGTEVTTKRADVATATVTFNWVKDYITMSDFVPAASQTTTSSNWNPLTFTNLTKRVVKNVAVADGATYKKVTVKFANLAVRSAIVAVQPAEGSSYDNKSILYDYSTGASAKWGGGDPNVVADYTKAADNGVSSYTQGDRSANTIAETTAWVYNTSTGDAMTAVKGHYPLFTPSGYKTGSRIAVNSLPRQAQPSLYYLGANEKYLEGASYFVFDGHSGADQTMTFYVADDAVVTVLSANTTITFSEDDGEFVSGTEYASEAKVKNEAKVSDTDVAWLILNGYMETNDIYGATNYNGYKARRLIRQDLYELLPQYGYALKGVAVATDTQYTDIIAMYAEDYQFDAEVGLVSEFTNHIPTVVHNTNNGVMNTAWKLETEWPPDSIFTDRNGIKQSNGTGTVVSWPFGLGLEEYDYYVKAFKDYGHMDAIDVGGTYTGDHMPMYSFKLNRDAEVIVFHKWNVWQDSTKGIPAFSMDEGWSRIAFETSGGLVVSNVENSSTSYDRRPLHEAFFKKYNAGDTVTIYTPANNEYVIPFIKECKQSVEPDVLLESLAIDGTALTGFDSNTFTYTYAVDAADTTVPVIDAVPVDGNAWVSVLYPTEFPGSAVINVMCADGSEGTYTINFTCDTALASNVVGDPDVTNWSTHNTSSSKDENGNNIEIPLIGENLAVGTHMIHDRSANSAAVVYAIDDSLIGNTYITAGHDWVNGSDNGDFDEVYKSTTLNTNWYTFDIARGATVKIVYKGDCSATASDYLEQSGYTYNGKSSGYFLHVWNGNSDYTCDTMYWKHFDIPEGQTKATISVPSLINKKFFVIIDFDGWE